MENPATRNPAPEFFQKLPIKRRWHHIMVVWSIHVERTANKDKTSVCTKCLNTFRNTDNQEG
jgi:hypothetical protein